MGLLFLIILLFGPVIVFLVGFIMLLASSEQRKQATRLMLIGAILLVAEILIGLAICSNMNLNFH